MSDSEPSTPVKKSLSQDSIKSELETPIGCFRCQKKACTTCWCTFNNYWKAISCFGVIFVYLMIGGAIFTAAERPSELRSIEEAQMKRMDARDALDELKLDIIYTITNNTNLTTDQAENFADDLVSAAKNLSDALEEVPAETNGPIWDFASAVFFASTVITTIGYGTIAPSTAAGQILFIFYAIIGIPIALIFLTTLGQIISDVLEGTLQPCTKHFGKDSITSRAIYFGLIILVALVFFIIIPAVIYNAIEDWDFRQSVYYCFVTLTTVGFGDFVPSQSGSSLDSAVSGFYKLCSTVWIWIGLAMIAALITELQNLIEATGKRLRKLRCVHRGVRDKRSEMKEMEKATSPQEGEGSGDDDGDEERLTTEVPRTEGDNERGEDV